MLDISKEISKDIRKLNGDGDFRSDECIELLKQADIVVSNPPYICTEVIDSLSEEVRLHDPVLALDGHEDGLYFYRKITKQAKGFLKPGGWLFYEIGYDLKYRASFIHFT